MTDEVSRTIVVDYENDNQRKRAEYQLDQKSNDFETYDGLVRRFEGSEEEFQVTYQTLVEKVGEEKLRVETAEDINMEDISASKEITYDLGVDENSVSGFLNYFFNSVAPGGEKTGEESFDLYSKKFGKGHVEYTTETTKEGTRVETRWEAGTEEALSGFTGLFEEEVDEFEEAQV
jgi:hypothetical protein